MGEIIAEKMNVNINSDDDDESSTSSSNSDSDDSSTTSSSSEDSNPIISSILITHSSDYNQVLQQLQDDDDDIDAILERLSALAHSNFVTKDVLVQYAKVKSSIAESSTMSTTSTTTYTCEIILECLQRYNNQRVLVPTNVQYGHNHGPLEVIQRLNMFIQVFIDEWKQNWLSVVPTSTPQHSPNNPRTTTTTITKLIKLLRCFVDKIKFTTVSDKLFMAYFQPMNYGLHVSVQDLYQEKMKEFVKSLGALYGYCVLLSELYPESFARQLVSNLGDSSANSGSSSDSDDSSDDDDDANHDTYHDTTTKRKQLSTYRHTPSTKSIAKQPIKEVIQKSKEQLSLDLSLFLQHFRPSSWKENPSKTNSLIALFLHSTSSTFLHSSYHHHHHPPKENDNTEKTMELEEMEEETIPTMLSRHDKRYYSSSKRYSEIKMNELQCLAIDEIISIWKLSGVGDQEGFPHLPKTIFDRISSTSTTNGRIKRQQQQQQHKKKRKKQKYGEGEAKIRKVCKWAEKKLGIPSVLSKKYKKKDDDKKEAELVSTIMGESPEEITNEVEAVPVEPSEDNAEAEAMKIDEQPADIFVIDTAPKINDTKEDVVVTVTTQEEHSKPKGRKRSRSRVDSELSPSSSTTPYRRSKKARIIRSFESVGDEKITGASKETTESRSRTDLIAISNDGKEDGHEDCNEKSTSEALTTPRRSKKARVVKTPENQRDNKNSEVQPPHDQKDADEEMEGTKVLSEINQAIESEVTEEEKSPVKEESLKEEKEQPTSQRSSTRLRSNSVNSLSSAGSIQSEGRRTSSRLRSGSITTSTPVNDKDDMIGSTIKTAISVGAASKKKPPRAPPKAANALPLVTLPEEETLEDEVPATDSKVTPKRQRRSSAIDSGYLSTSSIDSVGKRTRSRVKKVRSTTSPSLSMDGNESDTSASVMSTGSLRRSARKKKAVTTPSTPSSETPGRATRRSSVKKKKF